MATSEAAKQLGRWPVGSLLWKYSLPAIVGMLVMALYNVVDRLYVGRCVGADGLAGLALTFPATMVMLACGLLISVGTATRISIAMGQGKRTIAQCYLGQAVAIYLFLSLLVYPVCAVFSGQIMA
ncbi:MAG: MATE family efflux transporter, partial [Candidatus Spyradenecus sp.]